MSQLPQNKRGYIRGVRGLVVTPVAASGAALTPPGVPYGIRTAQQVDVETQVITGEASTLRGGDRLLAHVKDPNTVVGINLTFRNARFDAAAIAVLAGGTLVEEVEGENTRVIGWEAPTIEEQQSPPHFLAEVYAVSHDSRGGVEAYAKYTFYCCRATFGRESLQDQQWNIPELNIEVIEGSALDSGLYRKEFVDQLPAELTS